MWLGHDCIWMGLDKRFDLFFTPPEPVLSFFILPLPSATPRPLLTGCSLGLLNVFTSLVDKQHFYKIYINWKLHQNWIPSFFSVFLCSCFMIRVSAARLRTTKAVNSCFLSCFLPRIFGLSTNEDSSLLDAVTSSRKIKVGLKTMLQGEVRKKKKARKSRKIREREREREKQRGWK